MRSLGYKIARYCLIAQLVLFLLGVVAMLLSGEEPGAPYLYRSMSLLFSLANTLMWFGLFAPVVYNWLRGRSDNSDRFLLLGQLAELLRLGVPVPEALATLYRHQRSRWQSRFSNGCLSLELMSLATAQGDRLGQAMKRTPYFPAHWADLLDAAEVRERLVEVLEGLENCRTRQAWFSIWSGLRLIVIWLVGMPVAIFLATYILPTFVALFEGSSLQLPLATRVFIATVKFATSPLGAFILTGAPLALVALLLWTHYNPKSRGRLQAFAYSLPPFAEVLRLEDQASVAATLATCLQLEIPEDEALSLAALSTRHPAYTRALSGQAGIQAVLDSHPHLFAPPLRWLIAQGQRHGNLQEALNSAAGYLLDLAEERKHRSRVWLDALAVSFCGGLTLMLVLAVMMPVGMIIASFLEQLVLP